MTKKVFIVGPGYVGREIIDRLLALSQYEITTMVRREEAAKEFEGDGIKAVLGDLNDFELIQKMTEESDIVFHTATADHVPSAKAICEGIVQRANQGNETIYLHQSGASFLSDESNGNYKCETVYSDMDPETLDALPDTASHRAVDLTILEARKNVGTKAKIFIMMPPIIYGVNEKYKRLSIQIPTLTRFALKYGAAGHVGKGEAAWGVVHVFDLADAYMRILKWLEESPDQVALEHPYFFCENGEVTWGEAAKMIGDALHNAGRIQDPSPQEISPGRFADLFGEHTNIVVGSNCRNRADRLRKMGWKPTQPSLQESFDKEELPILLQEKGEFAGYGRAAAS